MSNRDLDAGKLVTEYMRTRGGDLADMHDAFDDKLIPPLPARDVDPMDTDNFLEELKKFNQYMEEVSRQANFGFDIRNCGWSDVLGKMKEANSAIARRMERDKTLLSKGARGLSDISNLLQPALQSLPDNLHLSRTKTTREIVNTFEGVITSLALAGNALEDADKDARLHDYLNRLQLTLLQTIPPLINVLVPEKLLSKVAALIKFPTADRRLEVIRTDAKRVEDRARFLGDQLASEASRITKDHVPEMHEDIRGIQAEQERMLDMVRCALSSQEGLANMLRDVVGELNYTRNRTSTGSTIRPDSPSLYSVATSPVADNNFATLKLILNVPTEHVVRDAHYVRRQEREFDQKSKNTAAVVFISPLFRRWMISTHSDLLYLDGRLEKSFDKTSPISYLCAHLVHQFKEGPHTNVTLSFFCGQHVAANDTLRGPRGLMRSLVVQVLQLPRPLVSLDDPDLGPGSLANVTGHEMIPTTHLCRLFSVLVGQIPAHYTVFCIVDDVNRLEKDEWEEDYWCVMRMLEGMVQREGEVAPFKVVLTSPARSRFITGEKGIGGEHRIEVNDGGCSLNRRGGGLADDGESLPTVVPLSVECLSLGVEQTSVGQPQTSFISLQSSPAIEQLTGTS